MALSRHFSTPNRAIARAIADCRGGERQLVAAVIDLLGASQAVGLGPADPILAAPRGTAAGRLITAVEGADGVARGAADLEALMERSASATQISAVS